MTCPRCLLPLFGGMVACRCRPETKDRMVHGAPQVKDAPYIWDEICARNYSCPIEAERRAVEALGVGQ